MPNETKPWIPICPGIKRRTIASGPNMYQMLAKLDAGCRMPEHKHAQEQIAHVVSGMLRLIVSGVPHEIKAGESFYLASNQPHGAEADEETLVIDTFSPPREDLLALDKQAGA
ncbi:MAG: cupin domain-containing protein [Verrucomicrobiota bacterium]|nr:cupin domain-containing protein [Verrucomicrobiota bacterium]